MINNRGFNNKNTYTRKGTKTMTKTIRKMISLIIAVTMIAAMSSFVMAADNPLVTVKKTDPNDTSAHTYSFHQVFKANVHDDGSLYDIDWADGITDDAAFYTALSSVTGFDGVTSVDDVLKKLEGATNNSAMVDAFADFISDKVAAATDTISLPASETSKQQTLSTGFGYYLVKDEITGANGNGAVSKFMLKVLNKTTNIDINTKEVVPTLDKKIVGGEGDDYNQASVGDEIKFELSSTVPDLRNKGYNKYCFVMNDTLSEGLTYIGTSDSNNKPLSVKIGSKTLTADEYTFTYDESNNKIEIVFKDFLDYGLNETYIGQPVTVQYLAKLNDKAKVNDEGNPNTANLVYSNDPSHNYTSDKPTSSDPTGKTPDQVTMTYTTGVKVIKTDKDGKKLQGAKFEITGTSADQVIVTKTEYVQDDTNGTYYLLADGTYTDVAPTTNPQEGYANDGHKYKLTTVKTLETKPATTEIQQVVDDDGILVLTGLGVGTYYIQEIEAPAGYVLDNTKHKVEVFCTFNAAGEPTWTYKIDDNDVSVAAGEAFVKLTIVNKKTTDLPETGGIGTKGFYLAGSMLLVAGAALIVLKKRNTADANR